MKLGEWHFSFLFLKIDQASSCPLYLFFLPHCCDGSSSTLCRLFLTYGFVSTFTPTGCEASRLLFRERMAEMRIRAQMTSGCKFFCLSLFFYGSVFFVLTLFPRDFILFLSSLIRGPFSLQVFISFPYIAP